VTEENAKIKADLQQLKEEYKKIKEEASKGI
jgi:hypothetical protein